MPYQSCVHSLKEIKLNRIIGFGPILTKQATGRNTAHQYQTLGTIISEKIIFIYSNSWGIRLASSLERHGMQCSKLAVS